MTSVPDQLDQIDQIAAMLRDADFVMVLTGAGISTESGIPDFRGPNGVWTKNPAAEKTATLQHYMGSADVRRQAWQNRTKGAYWGAEPNPAHHALVELERKGRLQMLVTQNVDGLHLVAGQSPEIVVEIHGNVREVKCLSCAWHAPMEVALDRVRNIRTVRWTIADGRVYESAEPVFGETRVERAR